LKTFTPSKQPTFYTTFHSHHPANILCEHARVVIRG